MKRTAATVWVRRHGEKYGEMSYGFASNLRDALPNASFIAFTGTPIEKTDANTLLHGVKDTEFEIYHGDTLTNEWDILRELRDAIRSGLWVHCAGFGAWRLPMMLGDQLPMPIGGKPNEGRVARLLPSSEEGRRWPQAG